MKLCYFLIFVWGILQINSYASAQTNQVDTKKFPLSRNDIENQKHGLVITDIEGISLKIGGYIQADFMYDTKDIQNRDAFQPSSITVPTYDNGGTHFSIRQSRLSFSASGLLKSAGDFNAILEFDLYGPNGSANPRIRHAWISIGKWGFGQYWSNFMDSQIWPNLVDYWGPNAYVWTRQVQLRYTQPLNHSNTLAFSIEQPGADVTFPADSATWVVRNLYPDITGSYTYSWNNSKSHLRLSGLLHPITYRTSSDNAVKLLGGAFNFSGNIRTTGNDALKFQVSYGTGYARYSEDISGLGYDALPNAQDQVELETSTQFYLWAFYDRWWSHQWSSTIGWGHISIDTKSYQPPATISHTNYGAVNLLWYPNKYFKTGVEVLYGNRKNLNGEKGEDLRIQFSAFITM